MDKKSFKCPNCGATVHAQGFGFVCDYCDSNFVPKEYQQIYTPNDDSTEIHERYEYLKKNERHIATSEIVTYEKEGDTYRIMSRPAYYANDGNYHRVLDFSITFIYKNDKKDDTLFLIVYTSKHVLQPHMSILLDDEFVIELQCIDWEGEMAFFTIEPLEFKYICESRDISMSSNIVNIETSHFEEFITYCRRFYNAVFDKRKYTYSIYKPLISDKNGK